MQFLADVGQFALKTVFIAVAVVAVVGFLLQLRMRMSSYRRHLYGELEIEKINRRFNDFRHRLQGELLSKKDYKQFAKSQKKEEKSEQKNATELSEAHQPAKGRLFVLEFDGDIRASQVESLREEVTALLSVAKPGDEVLARVESGGGMVTSYGLAASQLARLRSAGIRLTIAVDKVAASGGYMMACVGDHILAAPFAVVGSIGVIAQVPNFSRVLKKHDVDYREVTAGQFKRTVSLFGEITEPGMVKFREQIEDTHRLFKEFVAHYRPKLDLEKVGTGEHWYGTQAVLLGLVDEIMTSDDYIFHKAKEHSVYLLRYSTHRNWYERLTNSAALAAEKVVIKVWTEFERSRMGKA